MTNIFFELDRLKSTLELKGLDELSVREIVRSAEYQINEAVANIMDGAMGEAVDAGVQKNSPEFINELKPAPNAFELTTESGRTDFSLPPYPNLQNLLKNPKVAADGSRYKVIPVGGESSTKRSIATSIFDVQRAMDISRKKQAQAMTKAPKGSKVEFRTASSKQDASTKWVLPAKEADFSGTLSKINSDMRDAIEAAVNDIISEYVEAF